MVQRIASVFALGLMVLALTFLATTVTTPPKPVYAQYQQAPITVCNQHVYLQMGTATTTQLVAGVPGQNIRVCAYALQGYISGSLTTLQLVSGTTTTTACDTGQVGLSAPWTFATTTNNPVTFGTGIGQLFVALNGANLCALNTAMGKMNIDVSYTIF